MPRLMSVRYTEAQVRARTKDVTRRLGWTNLPVGSELDLCRQVMGRRKGQPLIRIARVRALSVRRESLSLLLERQTFREASVATPYALREVEREGFPELNPATFVDRYFVQAQKVPPDAVVTRIEWEYLPTPADWIVHEDWCRPTLTFACGCWDRANAAELERLQVQAAFARPVGG